MVDGIYACGPSPERNASCLISAVKKLLCLLIGVTALQVASAEIWEPATHECSLEFPDGVWTFQAGKEIDHGQVILVATTLDRTRDINVLRYRVASPISVRDPRFADGMKSGFAKTGGHMLGDGYTNVNGRVAYWFAGEGFVKGRTISTLRYALGESGTLYELVAESIGGSPLNDKELSAILASFQIHTEALPPAAPGSRNDTLGFRIGLVTGFLLVFIFGGGVVRKLGRKRA